MTGRTASAWRPWWGERQARRRRPNPAPVAARQHAYFPLFSARRLYFQINGLSSVFDHLGKSDFAERTLTKEFPPSASGWPWPKDQAQPVAVAVSPGRGAFAVSDPQCPTSRRTGRGRTAACILTRFFRISILKGKYSKSREAPKPDVRTRRFDLSRADTLFSAPSRRSEEGSFSTSIAGQSQSSPHPHGFRRSVSAPHLLRTP
jgi:hypothetical protein